ncbi:hypothetical protein [Tolypothrix sp. FACHB-123]|nr:hypothetical protein [Tolypothrix sp. FACHB-123]
MAWCSLLDAKGDRIVIYYTTDLAIAFGYFVERYRSVKDKCRLG